MDEALGIRLVVDIFLPKGGKIFAVEREGAFASDRDDIAFVEFQAHGSGNRTLRIVYKRVNRFFEGRKPQPIVDEFGIFESDHIFILGRGAVKNEGFEVAVCRHEDGAAGRFVNAMRFHPDQATFDQIHAPDAMHATDFVEFGNQFCGCELFAVKRNRIARIELDFDIRGFVRRVFWRRGEEIHLFVRLNPGLFKIAAFV